MPWFDYAALDIAGQPREGRIEAAAEAAARAGLESRGWVVLSLGAHTTRGDARPARGGRFGRRDLALVTRQLATLVEVAPLEEALRTLAAQAEKAAVRRTLGDVHAGIVEGQRLSAALARQPRAFPPLYRAMVAAGEGVGALPQVLARLADLNEREQAVRARLLTTLIYPAVLALVALAVVIALMTFVVPKVVEQFDSMGRSLPPLTRAVIAVSELMTGWGWLLLVLAALAALASMLALRREDVRLRVDRWLLGLPWLGPLLVKLHAARLARTLALMLESGLPMLEGLRASVDTVGNRVLRAATAGMAESIREGGSLSQALRGAGVFPPILLYMAASGEASGRLGAMLERAADYLEREFTTFTQVLMSLLEPAIIVVMGLLVALIVLSILLPILQFNTMVAR
ncbi:type II secretion system inner membrane protein GspF [Luteimonas sp. e5]